MKGVISEKNFTYYQFDVRNFSTFYDIVLTSISGNPDLVISLNNSNKFPNKEINDLISDSSLTIDSILITPDYI